MPPSSARAAAPLHKPGRSMGPESAAAIDLRRAIRHCPDCGQRFSQDAKFCPFDGVQLTQGTGDLEDPLLSTVVDGRYRVEEVLGEGGMGRVYRVTHEALGRPFAMKVLRSELAKDPDLSARFIHEAKATAQVRHPHVVSITDFGETHSGLPYFVMELLLGETLGKRLRREGVLPQEEVAVILAEVGAGLLAAHAAGIVHRDLKPENIFLVPLGNRLSARIVDFGAAKVLGSSRATRAGIVFGTPHYMSPEQAAGEPVDARADIYSLGVVAYELLCGRVPFEADSYMGIMSQHLHVAPEPIRVRAPAVSEALATVVHRCLEKEPRDRFQSMDEVRRELLGAADPNQPMGVANGLPRSRTGVVFAVLAGFFGLLLGGAVLAWMRGAKGSAGEPKLEVVPQGSIGAPVFPTPMPVPDAAAVGSATPRIASDPRRAEANEGTRTTPQKTPGKTVVTPPPHPRGGRLEDEADPFEKKRR